MKLTTKRYPPVQSSDPMPTGLILATLITAMVLLTGLFSF